MNFAELLTYEPATGVVRWRVTRRGRGCIAGREVGSIGHRGYRTVVVGGKRYYQHRIAWELSHGPIPAGKCIDHKDGDTGNNRLANLRIATLSENQRNRGSNARTGTGIAGVYPHRGGFAVHCAAKYIGHTKDFFEACCLRKAAERNAAYFNRGDQ